MLEPDAATDRAAALVARAIAAGADAADAVYSGDATVSIGVRLGKLEDADRAEREQLSLRAFVGQRSASIGTSDGSPAALEELAQRAVAMARAAPEDAWAGLAPKAMLLCGPLPALDLVDAAEPTPAELRAAALAAEDAMRASPHISNSEGASASAGVAVVALATSAGFARGYRATSHGLAAGAIAGEGGAMQRDSAWRSARHHADLPPPEAIGALAASRAAARLNPGRMPSGPMPVVFDPRVGGTLLAHLTGAISGAAIARRTSFLLGQEGRQLFDSAVTITDDPHRRRGLRSRPFDAEGLATRPRDIVTAGRLTGWLCEAASARQLGLEPTGHAARGGGGAPGVAATNLHLAPGRLSPAALIADIANGVYVTELIGMGVNPVTGDYSRGAAGFRIAGGALVGPVAEFTIAGNLLAMFAALTPADDLEFIRAVNVPTLRIDGMTVAGG